MKWFSAILLIAMCVTAVAVIAQESGAPRVLYIAEDEQGKVWANLTLTRQRTEEPYLPIVIGVQNLGKKDINLNRDTFWLDDFDGLIYTMPTVSEWRKNYGRIVIDRRMMTTGGIPWEVWYRTGKFGQTNFFPDLNSRRGNTTRDSVFLRRGHGMVDLLYFERPRNFEMGKPFFLNVQPKRWEVPIRMRLIVG